jgi:hypothetical protein
MFEDSTFESGGRIGKASKSKYWMVVTFIINGSILLLLILIPLIYPEAAVPAVWFLGPGGSDPRLYRCRL